MQDMHPYYPCKIEVRNNGGVSSIVGEFLYNDIATISDRGTVRKETFSPGAFDFVLQDEARDVHLLSGHSFDKPLASRSGRSLMLESTKAALLFEAILPDVSARPSWMDDAIRALAVGLVGGVSPGFRVPPKSVVPDAEELVDEEGNPDVKIRRINHAVLYELSLVTRPAYGGTDVDIRSMQEKEEVPRRVFTWLT